MRPDRDTWRPLRAAHPQMIVGSACQLVALLLSGLHDSHTRPNNGATRLHHTLHPCRLAGGVRQKPNLGMHLQVQMLTESALIPPHIPDALIHHWQARYAIFYLQCCVNKL